MKNNKVKLNYRFHDPNPPEKTAELIMQIYMENGRKKIEAAILEAIKIEEAAKAIAEEATK